MNGGERNTPLYFRRSDKSCRAAHFFSVEDYLPRHFEREAASLDNQVAPAHTESGLRPHKANPATEHVV